MSTVAHIIHIAFLLMHIMSPEFLQKLKIRVWSPGTESSHAKLYCAKLSTPKSHRLLYPPIKLSRIEAESLSAACLDSNCTGFYKIITHAFYKNITFFSQKITPNL